MINDPRELLTISSLGFRTVTCPMVGWSVFGRITAEATCKEKAFELAVEKVAEPMISVAAGLAASCDKVAMLEPERSRQAEPARTCALPVCSVLSLSPLKTVAPTDA